MTCSTCHDDGLVVSRDQGCAVARLCPDCVLDDGVCPLCLGTGWLHGGDAGVSRCRCSVLLGRAKRWLRSTVTVDGRGPLGAKYSGMTYATYEPRRLGQRAALVELERWVDAWSPDVAAGVLLWGSNGTGKTHLLVATLRALVLGRGVDAVMMETSHLLSAMRTRMDRGASPADLVEVAVGSDVLILDELAHKVRSPWALAILDEIVSRRYNAARPILAASNHALAELDLEPRIASRLTEMLRPLQVDGADARRVGAA